MKKLIRILICVDPQKDFIDQCLGNADVQSVVPNIVNHIDKKGAKYDFIITTQDYHHDETYLKTQEGKKLPIKHCIAGTEGVKFNDDIKDAICRWCMRPDKDYTFWYNVTKPAFGSLELPVVIENIMKQEGAKNAEIVVCGFDTDICVIACTLCVQAGLGNNMEHNAHITVDASCCAGTSVAKHNAALDVLESCLITVINR